VVNLLRFDALPFYLQATKTNGGGRVLSIFLCREWCHLHGLIETVKGFTADKQ